MTLTLNHCVMYVCGGAFVVSNGILNLTVLIEFHMHYTGVSINVDHLEFNLKQTQHFLSVFKGKGITLSLP